MILAQDSWSDPQITFTDSAESYIWKKGEVVQYSRVSGYESVTSLLKQRPIKRPYKLYKQSLYTPLEYCAYRVFAFFDNVR